MRKEIKLKTPDNHFIYGTIDSNKNQVLLLFVHGITGNQNEHQYFNAVSFFTKKGFDIFRFDFYSDKKMARSLTESSITSHSKDLELIIYELKKKYKKIILIGHSLGAPVILKTNLSSILKIVLWDPTTGFKDIKDQEGEYCPILDKYILHWGIDIIVGKQMVEEWRSLDINNLIEKLSIPCKFIFAGNYNNNEIWQPFLNNIKVINESIIIDGASHCFIEEGVEEKLFEETLKWIE